MKILLIGSGAREHAIAWKLSQSPHLTQLHISPGNAGTNALGIQVNLSADFDSILDYIRIHNIEMLVIGPEIPLVNGIVDYMKFHLPQLKIIGPGREGAQLEGSKDYAKEFMMEQGIPTASYHTIKSGELTKGYRVLGEMKPPYVLKADGLAAGKGVIITSDLEDAKSTLKSMLDGQFGESSAKVVIESFLTGTEFSVFALVDGLDYVLLPMAKDYKRIGDGDTGPNTGGMGAISPVDFVDDDLKTKVVSRIIEPTIDGLKKRKIHYCGIIFFGLINCDGDPYVIEYNCRLGDPETQVILPRLENDLVKLFVAASDGLLNQQKIILDPSYMANVVLASGGYPNNYQKGGEIHIGEIKNDQVLFHAGTIINDRSIHTNGGRVLSCCGRGNNLSSAIDSAYNLVDHVSFKGSYCRKDIGKDVLSTVQLE